MSEFNFIKDMSEKPNTMQVNKQLWDLYNCWYNHLKNINDKTNFDKLNAPTLITCSDSYMNNKNKVMIIAKEAKTDGVDFMDKITNGLINTTYQKEDNYIYDKQIIKIQSKCFEKTRALLCDIENIPNPKISDINKVLINNLNKSSQSGNYTEALPCYKPIYDKFKFNGNIANIFAHEIDILKPTHILLICGCGYDIHINERLGETFYNNIKNKRIKATKKATKNALSIECSTKDLGCKSYLDVINVIYAPHPSAHMKKEVREMYNQMLKDFITNK